MSQIFCDLLNTRITQRNTVAKEQQEQNITEDQEHSTVEELRNALEKCKNNKALGINNIPANQIKKGGRDLENQLMNVISLPRQEEEIPEQW